MNRCKQRMDTNRKKLRNKETKQLISQLVLGGQVFVVQQFSSALNVLRGNFLVQVQVFVRDIVIGDFSEERGSELGVGEIVVPLLQKPGEFPVVLLRDVFLVSHFVDQGYAVLHDSLRIAQLQLPPPIVREGGEHV